MIDTVLDFAIDHAAVFAALLVVVVVSAALTAVWIYGRYVDRAARRRGAVPLGRGLGRVGVAG